MLLTHNQQNVGFKVGPSHRLAWVIFLESINCCQASPHLTHKFKISPSPNGQRLHHLAQLLQSDQVDMKTFEL